MRRVFTFDSVLLLGSTGLAASLFLGLSSSPSAATAAAPPSSHSRLLDRYCVTCHNERLKTAGLRLDHVDVSRPDAEPEVWEKVVRKLRTGIMPPADMPQPSSADRHALLTWLETELDAPYAARPNPGRTETLRRLNRTEYRNAIRDLLALDIDAASLLPPDESGHGFDNVTVSDLPPTLLDRYISAAQKISRLAIGRPRTASTTSRCGWRVRSRGMSPGSESRAYTK
jgi:mono/diheme cytochrome c family protein